MEPEILEKMEVRTRAFFPHYFIHTRTSVFFTTNIPYHNTGIMYFLIFPLLTSPCPPLVRRSRVTRHRRYGARPERVGNLVKTDIDAWSSRFTEGTMAIIKGLGATSRIERDEQARGHRGAAEGRSISTKAMTQIGFCVVRSRSSIYCIGFFLVTKSTMCNASILMHTSASCSCFRFTSHMVFKALA